MFKCLMFTDLHFGVHQNSHIWLDASIKLAEEIKEKCSSENIKDIIFLGDFFHDRKNINLKTLWIANDFFQILKDVNIWMIIGNHDTYLKNDTHPHSLKSFEKYENVNIIEDTYKLNEFITLVSWNKQIKGHDTPYLCGHFDISGCELSSNFTESQETYKVSAFKQYKGIFSGHFHATNKSKNIFYIGSVMPFTFADIDCKRGYYIFEFDNTDYKSTFFEFTQCPKYIILNSKSDLDKLDLEDNMVKLIYDVELSSTDNDLLLSKIWEKKPLAVYTDLRNLSTELDDVVRTDIEFKNTKDILFEYIDITTAPEHIKIDKLKNIVNELLEIKEV